MERQLLWLPRHVVTPRVLRSWLTTTASTIKCLSVTMLVRRGGLLSHVVDGLAEGDRVVIHPSDQVEDGFEIRQR